MTSDAKHQKELFVSDLQGTSPWEILFICSTACVGCLSYLVLLQKLQATVKCRKHLSLIVLLAAEVLSFWLPMLVCQTTYLYPFAATYLVCQLLLGIVSVIVTRRGTDPRAEQSHRCSKPPTAATPTDTPLVRARYAITIHRGSLLLLTVTAILAVDFHVFPRRLGKTEREGYSLMDVGAASFVVAAGLVSKMARHGDLATADPATQKNNMNFRRLMPIAGMGLLRLVTHKGLDYQEHVSEYGIHWNFFFTLALLTPLAAMLGSGWKVPCVLLCTYQIALTVFGLQEWIESAPRTCGTNNMLIKEGWLLRRLCDLAVANREGLLGCLSFASLYRVTEYIAFQCFWSRRIHLWRIVLVLFGIWQTLVSFDIAVSRRSSNLPFCVWVLCINLSLLTGIRTIVEHMIVSVHDSASSLQPPVVLDSVNRNGLLVFVIANLLTGIVNLSVDTMECSNEGALAILASYLVVVGLIALALHRGLPLSLQRRLRNRTAVDVSLGKSN